MTSLGQYLVLISPLLPCSFISCLFFFNQDILLRPMTTTESESQSQDNEQDHKMGVAPWRYGPAQYWYDYIGVDEAGRNFSYNFKLKSVSACEDSRDLKF